MRAKISIAATLLVAACEPSSDRDSSGIDDSCRRVTCAEAGADCGTIDDGCGGRLNCGTCLEPETCGGAGSTNVCGCQPDCDDRCSGDNGCGGTCPSTCVAPETCGGGGIAGYCGCTTNCISRCGGDDGCGGTCADACTLPETCGGGGVDDYCGCITDCDGKCGVDDGCGGLCPVECPSAFDSCLGGVCTCPVEDNCAGRCGGDDGCGGTCVGSCTAPETCGGGGTANVCGCTPATCTSLLATAGVACGAFDDGCASTLLCDDACGSQVCDIASAACCTPQCSGVECGADGCGGSCGECDWPEICGGDGNFSACSSGPKVCVAGSQWCFEIPKVLGHALNAVSASSASNAWMAGEAGVLLHWTGTQLAVSDANTSEDLHAVYTLDAQSAWAVGDDGTFLRYDGNWTNVAGNNTADLRAVFALGAGQVWATGDAGVILWYDGNTTTQVTSGTSEDLLAVFGFDINDTFVGGSDGTILRRGDGAWAGESPDTDATVRGFWGTSASDLWAVATAVDSDDAVILHRVGDNNWQKVAPEAAYNDTNASTAILGVWGANATNVWAASNPLARYDGTSWQPDLGAPSGDWRGVGGSSANDVWAVGALGNIVHRSALGWTAVTSGALRPTDANWHIRVMHGVDANTVIAVTYAGEAWHSTNVTWETSTLPLATGYTPKAVWVVSASEAWALADKNGTSQLLRAKDGSWTNVSTGATNTLRDVWASSASDVWLVGTVGKILRGGITGFSTFSSGTTSDLVAVYGLGTSSVWVASSTELRRWDGTQWESPKTLTSTPKALWASSTNDVWVLGASSIQHCTPSCSATTLPPITGNLVLEDLWGTSSTNVWAVGNASGSPVILRWQGTSWSRETTNLRSELRTVYAADANTTFVGGSTGLLRR